MFNTLGTPPNVAIHGYLNDNKVPQLFVATGADKWNDPKHFPGPWAGSPSYRIEARIYANYILKNLPNAKIAVLYQNDDFGKDYLIGLRDGLGDKADKMIVATQDLRDHRSDRRFAGRGAARQRRRCAADRRDSEIRRAGDPQGLRHRLEADALPHFGVEFGRHRDEARRARERRRHHLRGLSPRIPPIRSGRTRPNTRTGWRA